ncbi:hypothetical protein AUP44_03825 [Tistrella mobilis]|uniref:Uncharacterized protein n=1 Tax=Tistrella mobilis TaxID=171437 RepID=A0A161Q4U9_9PROT|nr:hypothetical protein AUP44_03825 [Tistrella mobilis]
MQRAAAVFDFKIDPGQGRSQYRPLFGFEIELDTPSRRRSHEADGQTVVIHGRRWLRLPQSPQRRIALQFICRKEAVFVRQKLPRRRKHRPYGGIR